MTRSELIKRLAMKFPHLSIIDADLSTRIMLDGIAGHLAKGGRAEIRDFGTFSLNVRPSRLARNPKTGVKVQIPEKTVPHFKPGRDLRLRVKNFDLR